MKMISMLATLLVGASAFAYPALNDTATYNISATNGTQSVQGTMTFTISAHDAAAAQFTLTQTIDIQGQVQSDSAQVGEKDLLAQATVLQILGNCAAAGGSDESVTVPAGTFQTCKISQSNSAGDTVVVNIGDVTFGIVKQVGFQAASNETDTLELVSHKAGQ